MIATIRILLSQRLFTLAPSAAIDNPHEEYTVMR